jgi:IS1 family transposase
VKKNGYSGKTKIQRYRCMACRATFLDPAAEKPLEHHYTDLDTAARALGLMMEGASVRSISRLTGLHIATILGLMNSAGEKCERLMEAKFRGLRPQYVQADEIHSYVGCHQNRLRPDAPKEWGSIWCWIALDSTSKLAICHHVGDRDATGAWELMRKLRERTVGIFQLTSDGLKHYTDAVDAHFATFIHFAQLIKLFSGPDFVGPDWFGATSRVTGTIPCVRSGQPEPHRVSTSHIERLSLSVRTHLRRYVRRTNAHSRKLANHKACVSLWLPWYNFCRPNSAVRMTPCMASGITTTIWTMRDLLGTQI